jgi:hypothetical protein
MLPVKVFVLLNKSAPLKVLFPLKVLLLVKPALVPKLVVIVVEKFESLPKAVASSFNVFKLAGADAIKVAIESSTYFLLLN